jgi:hypothetical protein
LEKPLTRSAVSWLNLPSIDSLHELLDYLRVCIKYQAFDLEATRRENEYLRKLLEEEGR